MGKVDLYIAGVTDLLAGQADFIDEILELLVSVSDFDEYFRMHFLRFCMSALDASRCRLSILSILLGRLPLL